MVFVNIAPSRNTALKAVEGCSVGILKGRIREMAKMTVNRKAQLILGLAMKINNTPTKQKLTGDKPTVFVWFSGHVNELQVWIYSKGWFANATSDYYWGFDLSKDTNKKMDECIALLKDIWKKYKPTQVKEVSTNAV